MLQQVVLTRLTKAVYEWNPLEDVVPIDKWVCVWMPHLSDHLHTLFPVIRNKLMQVCII